MVCMYTSLLRSLLHINSCTLLQASCLITPPLPFFSVLNEALSVHRCRAQCTPFTLFSHDFPPERGVLFDLICLKSHD